MDISTDHDSPKPQRTLAGKLVHASHWGINRNQLSELVAKCRSDGAWHDGDNVRSFVEKFVKPKTDGLGMGYALFVNQRKPLPVNLMVSHSWEENALRFFEDLHTAMASKENAFICFLSLYQNSAEDIAKQLGSDVMQGPFTIAIAATKNRKGRLLVVSCEELRENGQGLYSRMWCDLEIYHAIRVGCHIQFSRGTTMEHLFGNEDAVSFSSFNARCGNPALPMNRDEQQIRSFLQSHPVELPEIRRLARMTWVPIVCLALTIAFMFLWESCIRFHPKDTTFVRYWWQFLLAVVILVGWAYVARKCTSQFFAWMFPSRGGYAELDTAIRAAAEFQRLHPNFWLDTDRWGIAWFWSRRMLWEAVGRKTRQLCRSLRREEEAEETLPYCSRGERYKELRRILFFTLLNLVRLSLVNCVAKTFYDTSYKFESVCVRWFSNIYAAIGGILFLQAFAEVSLSTCRLGYVNLSACFFECLVAGCMVASGLSTCHGQKLVDGVYPPAMTMLAFQVSGAACVVAVCAGFTTSYLFWSQRANSNLQRLSDNTH